MKGFLKSAAIKAMIIFLLVYLISKSVKNFYELKNYYY